MVGTVPPWALWCRWIFIDLTNEVLSILGRVNRYWGVQMVGYFVNRLFLASYSKVHSHSMLLTLNHYAPLCHVTFTGAGCHSLRSQLLSSWPGTTRASYLPTSQRHQSIFFGHQGLLWIANSGYQSLTFWSVHDSSVFKRSCVRTFEFRSILTLCDLDFLVDLGFGCDIRIIIRDMLYGIRKKAMLEAG